MVSHDRQRHGNRKSRTVHNNCANRDWLNRLLRHAIGASLCGRLPFSVYITCGWIAAVIPLLDLLQVASAGASVLDNTSPLHQLTRWEQERLLYCLSSPSWRSWFLRHMEDPTGKSLHHYSFPPQQWDPYRSVHWNHCNMLFAIASKDCRKCHLVRLHDYTLFFITNTKFLSCWRYVSTN